MSGGHPLAFVVSRPASAGRLSAVPDEGNIMIDTIWNPNAPHCMEDRRYVSPDGKDGGGHSSCMTELSADGTCPNADEHHRAWINFWALDRARSSDDWAASVIAARTS